MESQGSTTTDQLAQMMALMQTQQQQTTTMMQKMMELQQENAQLRESQTRAKRTRIDRPSIEANLNDSEWALFEDTWKRYKTMSNISDPAEIRMELRTACSQDVNKLLF